MANHKHVEAYCLMTYRSDDGTEEEILWNSRDGVTPFVITLKSGKSAKHIDWLSDRYAPDHKPQPGDRVFIDLTRDKALEYARRNLERWKSEGADMHGAPSVEKLAESYLHGGQAPDIIVWE